MYKFELIRKVTHWRKVRKSNKLFKSANLRICDLRNLFTNRSPLQMITRFYRAPWLCCTEFVFLLAIFHGLNESFMAQNHDNTVAHRYQKASRNMTGIQA
jgi:hypothetical protein